MSHPDFGGGVGKIQSCKKKKKKFFFFFFFFYGIAKKVFIYTGVDKIMETPRILVS